MLTDRPHETVPTCCRECEFSFDLHEPQTQDLVCCVRTQIHHHGQEMLCPWYVRLGTLDLKLELAHIVPPWLKAIAIQALQPPADLDSIVNIINDFTGRKLATVEEEDHEEPDPDKPT